MGGHRLQPRRSVSAFVGRVQRAPLAAWLTAPLRYREPLSWPSGKPPCLNRESGIGVYGFPPRRRHGPPLNRAEIGLRGPRTASSEPPRLSPDAVHKSVRCQTPRPAGMWHPTGHSKRPRHHDHSTRVATTSATPSPRSPEPTRAHVTLDAHPEETSRALHDRCPSSKPIRPSMASRGR